MTSKLDLSLFTAAGIGELKRYLSDELTMARVKNDTLKPDEDTSHLRGRIAMIKSILLELEPKAAATTTKRATY